MLVNPGGPGGSGLIYSILGAFVPNDGGDAYDWIGFDPRGVGSSHPSLALRRHLLQRPAAAVRADHRADPEPVGLQVEGLRQGVHPCRRPGAVQPRQDHRHDRGHGEPAHRARAAEDQLLRVLLRHLPRQRLHDAAPRPGPALRPRQHGRPARRVVPDNQAQDIAFQTTFKAYWPTSPSTATTSTSVTPRRRWRTPSSPPRRHLNAHPADGDLRRGRAGRRVHRRRVLRVRLGRHRHGVLGVPARPGRPGPGSTRRPPGVRGATTATRCTSAPSAPTPSGRRASSS